jgi:hypothetical protein
VPVLTSSHSPSQHCFGHVSRVRSGGTNKSKVGQVKDTFSRALSVAYDAAAEEVASVPEDQRAELLPLTGVLRTFHNPRQRPGTYAITLRFHGGAATRADFAQTHRIYEDGIICMSVAEKSHPVNG